MDTPEKNHLATTSKFEVFPLNPAISLSLSLSILFLFTLLLWLCFFIFIFIFFVSQILFGYREIELEKKETHVFNFMFSSFILTKKEKPISSISWSPPLYSPKKKNPIPITLNSCVDGSKFNYRVLVLSGP